MKNLVVTRKYDNKKLNTFLLKEIPNLTSNFFYKLLRKKDIKVNGKRVNQNITVYDCDEIQVYITDAQLANLFHLNVEFEDDNILVVNKPYNIEVTGENSLTTKVHEKYKDLALKPMPCHRIDRNTTGLVLFAKNKEALDILFDKFKHHEIEKHYLALVYGIPKEPHKTLEHYLFKDNKKAQVFIHDTPKKGYQKIITSYHIITPKEDNTCLLDVQIQTGRTHQIRAHLAYIGHPIIGDGKYGINEVNKKFKKKYQMLCSYILKFNFQKDAGMLNYLNGKTFCLDIKDEKKE